MLLVEETVMKNKNLRQIYFFMQVSCTRRLAQVSGTSFLSVCHRHYSNFVWYFKNINMYKV